MDVGFGYSFIQDWIILILIAFAFVLATPSVWGISDDDSNFRVALFLHALSVLCRE